MFKEQSFPARSLDPCRTGLGFGSRSDDVCDVGKDDDSGGGAILHFIALASPSLSVV